jgi:hypothetical protein
MSIENFYNSNYGGISKMFKNLLLLLFLLLITMLSACSTKREVVYETIYPSLPQLSEPNVLSLDTCQWTYPIIKDDKVFIGLDEYNFKCYIENDSTFGWCHYAFRYINCIDTLKEIDFYTRDTIRAMKTGKHNFGNINAVTDEDFKRLGWISLVDLYNLYHEDFDYYCEIIDLIN